jgi:hypothetical protein
MAGGALALACAATLGAVANQRPGMNSDPAWGIVAAEQYLLGQSPTPLDVIEADPADLTRNRVGRVSWWPPSYQLVPLAFRMLGLDWGNALRLTFIAFWLAGALAWGLLFAKTLGRGPALLATLAAFLLLRFAHADASIYSGGEFLLWALSPMVLLLNLAALGEHRARWPWAAGAGLVTPWLFLVKFNAAFTIIGLGATWTLLLTRRWITWPHWLTYAAAGCASGLAILALGFPSGTTTFDPNVQVRATWTMLWPFGAAAFAATDWDSLLRWLFQHPSGAMLTDRHFEIMYGVCAVPVLVWAALQLRSAMARPTVAADVVRILSMVCFLVGAALLAFVAAESRSYLIYARYLRIESLLVLPLVLAAIGTALRSQAPARRVGAALALMVLLIIPAAYGASALLTKGWWRAGARERLVATAGIRYDFFRPGEDVPRIIGELRARVTRETVIYLPSPELGLAFTDYRFIIRHPDFVPREQLSAERFVGTPAHGVALFLPEHFRTNGKLAAIQQSFREIARWTEEPMASTSAWFLVFGAAGDQSGD